MVVVIVFIFSYKNVFQNIEASKKVLFHDLVGEKIMGNIMNLIGGWNQKEGKLRPRQVIAPDLPWQWVDKEADRSVGSFV